MVKRSAHNSHLALNCSKPKAQSPKPTGPCRGSGSRRITYGAVVGLAVNGSAAVAVVAILYDDLVALHFGKRQLHIPPWAVWRNWYKVEMLTFLPPEFDIVAVVGFIVLVGFGKVSGLVLGMWLWL